jgi:hypothetical protein
VKECDGAIVHAAEDGVSDLAPGESGPALGINRPENDVPVSHLADIGGDRGVGGAVGRAKVRFRRDTSDTLNDGIGLLKLAVALFAAYGSERGMIQGVVHQDVAIGDHPAQQVGIGLGPNPGDGETGTNTVPREDIEDLRGVAYAGFGIKGEGDEGPAAISSADGDGARGLRRRVLRDERGRTLSNNGGWGRLGWRWDWRRSGSRCYCSNRGCRLLDSLLDCGIVTAPTGEPAHDEDEGEERCATQGRSLPPPRKDPQSPPMDEELPNQGATSCA